MLLTVLQKKEHSHNVVIYLKGYDRIHGPTELSTICKISWYSVGGITTMCSENEWIKWYHKALTRVSRRCVMYLNWGNSYMMHWAYVTEKYNGNFFH